MKKIQLPENWKEIAGLAPDAKVINEDTALRLEPASGVDRETITRWLVKHGHIKGVIPGEKVEKTGTIVVPVPYNSFQATAIIGAIKKFSNFRIATLKSPVKVEGGKPVATDVHSDEMDKVAKPKEGALPGTTELKLTKTTAPVEVAKGGAAKGDVSNGDKPDALKSIWKKAPTSLELKKV